MNTKAQSITMLVMHRIVDMGLPTVQASAVSVRRSDVKEKHLTVFRAREIATQPDWIERAIAYHHQKVFLH